MAPRIALGAHDPQCRSSRICRIAGHTPSGVGAHRCCGGGSRVRNGDWRTCHRLPNCAFARDTAQFRAYGATLLAPADPRSPVVRRIRMELLRPGPDMAQPELPFEGEWPPDRGLRPEL